MSAVWLRLRAELRGRWRSWLGLALIVGLAGGAVLLLAAGARRTDSAFERFLRSQRAYDVLVVNNPGEFGGEGGTALLDLDRVRRLPQVADAAPVNTFFLTLGAGIGAFVPPDDHIGNGLNEFKMLAGRRVDPDRPHEAVVSFTLADQYGLEVGDDLVVIPPTFLRAYEAFRRAPEQFTPEDAQYASAIRRVLDYLPGGKARIVGVEASPGEFPPQIEGSGRYLVHMSPALSPVRHELAGLSEGGESLLIRLRRGTADVDAFLSRVEELGGGTAPDIVVARELNGTAQRSFRTQAVALWLLALLTTIASLLVIGQLLSRMTATASVDNRTLAALGATPAQRTMLGIGRAAVIGVVGGALAVAVAVALSPLFPTGLARTAEPEPGVRLDPAVLMLGFVGVVVATVLLTAWPAWRSSRRSSPAGSQLRNVSYTARLLAHGNVPVVVGSGVRLALEPGRGRTSVPVRTGMAGVTLGVATLVAAITFGASLTHLLATPSLYGQTWDAQLTTYDSRMVEQGLPALEADDHVVGIAVGDFHFPFTVNGTAVDGLAMDTVDGYLSPVIIEGRAPTGPDEIALGTKSLRAVDADLGDTVEVGLRATRVDPVRMKVVGRAVFPLFAEAGSLGEGAFTTSAAAKRVRGQGLRSFEKGVLIRLESPNDVDRVAHAVRQALDPTGELYVIRQGKPTDIVNFGRVEATPYLLGAILAALSTATLSYLLVSSVRRRRRELAILKTLGFVRRQVRASIGWQATTLVAVALCAGIPLGIAAGRWIWTLFADELGVVDRPWVPLPALLALAAIAILVANLVAAIPAAVAARTRPAVVLRAE